MCTWTWGTSRCFLQFERFEIISVTSLFFGFKLVKTTANMNFKTIKNTTLCFQDNHITLVVFATGTSGICAFSTQLK